MREHPNWFVFTVCLMSLIIAAAGCGAVVCALIGIVRWVVG